MRMSRGGDLGEMIGLFSRRLVSLNPNRGSGWRGDHANSGGVLLEINIHEIDWMMAAGGELEAVYARFHAEESEHPRANDFIWLMMEFQQGATGMHEGSWSHDIAAFQRSAQGSKGAVATGLHGKGLFFKPRDGERREITFEEEKIDPNDVFVQAIENGEETEVNHEWGLKVMRAAEAFCLSAAEKRRVLLSEIQ
jgi:predicted dehydrogenase